MAIEIAPKKKVKIPTWSVALLVIGLLLVVILFISYVYFIFSSKKMEETLKETPQEAFLKDEIAKKEREAGLYKTKIDTFGKLLLKHQRTANILDFLEKSCLPTVWFSEFDFSSEEGKVIIAGHTDNFISLGQQILILKADPLLEKVNLPEVSLNPEKGINFSLLLNFNPQIFY